MTIKSNAVVGSCWCEDGVEYGFFHEGVESILFHSLRKFAPSLLSVSFGQDIFIACCFGMQQGHYNQKIVLHGELTFSTVVITFFGFPSSLNVTLADAI